MSIKTTDKIAVTGGTGFLGSHILRGLVEKGYQNIYALKRRGSVLDLVPDIKDRIHWVEGDILDVISLEELVKNANIVIHSAAKVSYNPKDGSDVHQINVEGTANVVNASLGAGVNKLLFISSVAAIGRPIGNKVISESTEWHEDERNSNYAISKHLAELDVWRGMVEGLNVGILNPSMILGPSYWGESSTKLFTYAEAEKSFYPSGSNGFVDVRDVAKLTILMMESEIVNKRVIAVSEMYSYKKLLKSIANALEVKPPTKQLSKFLAKIIWRISSFQKDPAITKETVRITSGNYTYNNELSKHLFNHEYYSVESSIEDTVALLKASRQEKKNFAFFERIFD